MSAAAGGHSWIERLFSYAGQRVLVTGASRGIGRALALGFAQAGAALILTARSAEALEATAAEIAALGGTAQSLACDQRDIASIRHALALAGPVDLLVNNAGVEELRPARDVDEALWDRIMQTNLKGAFFVAQAVAEEMAGRGGGAIINIASLTSFVGVPKAVPYTTSKAGLLGMTRGLAAEWGAAGIRVNAIAPGYFETDLTAAFYADPAWVAAMTAKVPLGRLGELADLVGAALFLGSRAAGYMTGQCLVIDGGYLSTI